MKRFYDSLKNNLFCPFYLFYGEEQFLIDEALATIKKKFSPAEQNWDIEIADGEIIGLAAAIDMANQSSFFSGRRLLIIKNINWFSKDNKKADDSALLTDYLQNPNPDMIMIATLNGNIDKRRKIYTTIEDKGRLIACPALKPAEKEAWLKEHLLREGVKVDSAVLNYISLNCQNLSQMAMEAAKLRLYMGQKEKISLQDARQIVSQNSMFSIFELTDALATKNARAAIACYQQLLQRGEAEQQILGLLSTQFQNMLAVADMLRNGYRANQMAKTLAIHPFVAEKCARQCRNFTLRQMIKALEIFLAADIAQKSGEGEMKDLLENAILRICAF